MLYLFLQAPFAACRTFTAGWYRPTATFLTPSAAYGLILNIAAVESRLYERDPGHDGSAPATFTKPNLPGARLAVGAARTRATDSLAASLPTVQTVYQQLHNYPVGKDAGMPAELSKGTKNNITPVRRELLCNLRCYIGLDASAELENRVARGLKGELNANRYGVPFLGDNQFLIDHLEIVSPAREPEMSAYWYSVISESSDERLQSYTARLTVAVNRGDMSQTDSRLFRPSKTAASTPPADAWVEVGHNSN